MCLARARISVQERFFCDRIEVLRTSLHKERRNTSNMFHTAVSCFIMPLCTLNKVASGNRTRGGKPVFSPGRAHHPSARINSLTARSRGSFARDAIGIYYGTTSGCTKAAARIIKDLMVRLDDLSRQHSHSPNSAKSGVSPFLSCVPDRLV